MSSADDPRKKVEYLLPTKVRGYQPPSTQDDAPLMRPLLRMPEDPDVPSSGWFDAARVESKRLRVSRRQQLWKAVTEYIEQYRKYLGEWEQYQLALNRARKIQRILDNDDAEFDLEMEQKEQERQQIRSRWAEEEGGGVEIKITEDPMAHHRKAIHDMFMLPQKIRAEAEQFIQDSIVTKRGGVHNLTDYDKEEIEKIREQIEEYITSLRERGY